MIPAEKCPRTEDISALVDHELDEPARLTLAAHLTDCALCSLALAEFRQLQTSFAALPEVSPGVHLASLLDRRISDASISKPKPQPRRWRWWQLAPAALGGALSLSFGAYLGSAVLLGTLTGAPPATLQMAAFAAIPPGALCPAAQNCNRTGH